MSRTLFLFSALALLLSIMFVGPASAINDDAWADDMTDWGYRVPITITNPPTAANVQRMINLTYQENMQADFDDIRFRTSSGSSIDYWIEEKTDSSYAHTWVELPSANMAYVYVYFGNPAAVDASDPDSVFEFYDDFPGSAYDSTKWDLTGTAPTVSGGILSWTADVATSYLNTKATFGKNTEVRLRIKGDSSVGVQHVGYVNGDATTDAARYRWREDHGHWYVSTSHDGVYDSSEYLTTHDNVWGVASIIRNGDTSTIYKWDGTTEETSTTIPDGSLNVQLYATRMDDDGAELYCSYVMVLKYDAAATSFAVGTPEEQQTDVISYPGYDSPTDPDADGLYEDVNGNSRIDFQDIMLFFQYNKWAANNQPNASCFDWSGNGAIEFSDVSAFWESDFT